MIDISIPDGMSENFMEEIFMVKIIVMGWHDFNKMVISDIGKAVKTGSFSKQEDVIYAESLGAARRLMTSERLRMLVEVKKRRPRSLYELAKMMKKDIKTISTDATILSQAGLMKLEKYNVGKRKKVRPIVSARKIQLEFAI